jgi:hypothetical protein
MMAVGTIHDRPTLEAFTAFCELAALLLAPAPDEALVVVTEAESLPPPPPPPPPQALITSMTSTMTPGEMRLKNWVLIYSSLFKFPRSGKCNRSRQQP